MKSNHVTLTATGSEKMAQDQLKVGTKKVKNTLFYS
jgi:hypothetical protein